MKSIVSLMLILFMLVPTLGLAAGKRKDCPECDLKTNARAEEKINRVCNDVSDILCKDVKAEERRSCSESDEYIFSKNTTQTDIYNFAKGCFKSGVTSFTQFFTDFLPELLKGIWQATKATASLAVKSVNGGDGPGLWSKLKGMYESTSSVAADIYEAVQENPGAYFDKIWSKVVDVVGPMVANYDCLKPQRKVENICGFIMEWIVPPAMLAKILVRGIKEVKFLKSTGAFSGTASGKLAKALDYSEKRSLLSLKQLQEMERKFRALGYTNDEFIFLYKSGALEKVNLSELKFVSTIEGKIQKKELMGEPKIVKAAAAATTVEIVPKKPATVEVRPKPEDLNLSSDFFTTNKTGLKGETLTGQGQIIERIVVDGKEAAYRVRMLAPNGKIMEVNFSAQQMAELNAKNASTHVAEKIADAVRKDTRYKSPEAEFLELQKTQTAPVLKEVVPVRESIPDYWKDYEGPVKTYVNGIDYVPTPSPGVIVRNVDRVPTAAKPVVVSKDVIGPFESNYVQVMARNSMGVTNFMPAQIIGKVTEDGVEKFVIRMLDKASNTYKEQKVTLGELKTKMRAKEGPRVESEIKEFNRQTGFREDLQH